MPRPRVLAAALLAAVLVVAGACTGDDEAPTPATGTTPSGTAVLTDDPALAYSRATDPALPVCIGLGRRAAIVLPADPSAGERWRVVAGPDRAIAVPVGTEFVTGDTTLPDAPDTEVLSYAGAAVGSTAVEVVRIGADGAPVGDGVPLRFQIEVTVTGECPPPPAPEGTTTIPGAGAEGLGAGGE